MKTKTTLYIILLGIIGLSFFSFTKSQISSKKYITVRTFEIQNGLYDSKIVISFEDGKTEEIELAKLKSSNLGENTKTITHTLNDLSAKGYELFSTSSGGGDACSTNTFIFVKK